VKKGQRQQKPLIMRLHCSMHETGRIDALLDLHIRSTGACDDEGQCFELSYPGSRSPTISHTYASVRCRRGSRSVILGSRR